MVVRFFISATVLLSIGLSSHARALRCQSYLNSPLPHRVEHDKILNRLQKNDFFVARTFDRYATLLTSPKLPSLLEFLRSLKHQDIYLDAGAGEAKALVELITRTPELGLPALKYLAVALKRPGLSDEFKKQRPDALSELDRHLVRHAKQFKYIDGDFIENLAQSPVSELYKYRNRVSLITDIYGPFSYSTNLEGVLKTYADLLKVGGQALIHFYDPGLRFTKTNSKRTRPPQGLNKMLTLIPELTQGRLQVMALEAQHEGRWPQSELSILWVKKISDVPLQETQVHLSLKHLYDEAPPIRTYEWADFN